MSGMITTDPFEILDSVRPFMRTFTNLSGIAGNKMNNISNLKTCQSQLFRMSSDKVAKECTEVLNSFPPNKVPGNDGLPVEFCKMSWASIGTRMF